MRLTFDIQELVDFTGRLEDKHRFDSAMMTATRNIAEVLHDYLLKLTPVDTGNLRKMWSAGDNLKFTVDRVPNGFMVTLINTATNKRYLTKKYPDGYMYASAVNDGHKGPYGKGWVVGHFFVENSINIISATQVERIVMTELQKWWDSV